MTTGSPPAFASKCAPSALPAQIDRALFEELWQRYCDVALNEAVFAEGYVDRTLAKLAAMRESYERRMRADA